MATCGLGFIAGAPSSSRSRRLVAAASLGETTRVDFSILDQKVNGVKLIYLDNAATSQKPEVVLAKELDYNKRYNSNVHRGIHSLSTKATDAYETARSKVASFINARLSSEIVFTRNATEALNLVAKTWAKSNLKPGDEVLLSVAEHHSNLVPWQDISKETGAVLKHVGLTMDKGTLDLEDLKVKVSTKTKIISLHHVSNTLGSINPMEEIIRYGHQHGAMVLVDACQSVPHMPVDVQALDADFLVFSSHKMCGPTGIGVLYGKYDILKAMPPFMGGGEMINEVFLDHSTFADPPLRFEAGTPAIAQAIGLGAAVDYLSGIGMDVIHAYEMELSKYLYTKLSEVPGVRIYGPKEERAALCSFNIEGCHATDLATILDSDHGVAIRSGHHCTMPLHKHLNIRASARASLYFYNTQEEVDQFVKALQESISFFK